MPPIIQVTVWAYRVDNTKSRSVAEPFLPFLLEFAGFALALAQGQRQAQMASAQSAQEAAQTSDQEPPTCPETA